MKGQRICYIRVSSFDQSPDRQLEHVQVDSAVVERVAVSRLSH